MWPILTVVEMRHVEQKIRVTAEILRASAKDIPAAKAQDSATALSI